MGCGEIKERAQGMNGNVNESSGVVGRRRRVAKGRELERRESERNYRRWSLKSSRAALSISVLQIERFSRLLTPAGESIDARNRVTARWERISSRFPFFSRKQFNLIKRPIYSSCVKK